MKGPTGVARVASVDSGVVVIVRVARLLSQLLKIFLPHFFFTEGQAESQGAQDEAIQGCYHCQDVDPSDLTAAQGVETNLARDLVFPSSSLTEDYLVSTDGLHMVLGPRHREHTAGDHQQQAGEDLQTATHFIHTRGTEIGL